MKISSFKHIAISGTVFATVLFSFFCLHSQALDYYADIQIDVTDAGFVTIKGTTNHPDLLVSDSYNYTSKIKDEWVLNITKKDFFSQFYFIISLPRGASLYSLNSTAKLWIEEESHKLIIKGFGEKDNIIVIIGYKLNKSSAYSGFYFSPLSILFISIIIILVLVIMRIYYSSSKSKQVPNENSNNLFLDLSNRQKQIMILLHDSNVPLTQTNIQKALQIPKAAVSRNIHSLERKGLIEIKKIGMSHFINIKKL
ncbi:MAG: MarR family transcriptional regulator [Thermoplasmatota archaeon]